MSNNTNNGLSHGPYQIIISESQRILLVKVIQFALKDNQFCTELYHTADQYHFARRTIHSNQLAELKSLLDMTEQLRGCDGDIIQGFCL